VFYCAESPVCAQLGPIAGGAAKLNGLKFYSAKIAATSPNYTAPCLAAKGAGVDALFIGDNATVVERVVASCLQQGYTPVQVGNIGTVATSSLAHPGFAGARLAGANANPFDTSTPVIQEFRAALNKYAPGLLSSSSFSYDTVWAWAGGKLFEAAAKAAHVTPSSTRADVKNGLYALKDDTLGGLAPPLTFTRGKPAFVACYFSVTIKGGNLVSLNSNKPTCLTPAVVKAIATQLKG
jgi:branched-chain amino acid transport system substrate-binding protein